jgi:ribosomal protein S9
MHKQNFKIETTSEHWVTIGRRKTAVAIVSISRTPTSVGNCRINAYCVGCSSDSPSKTHPKSDLFVSQPREHCILDKIFLEILKVAPLQRPLSSLISGGFDIAFIVHGGGYVRQVAAIKVGLSRALVIKYPKARTYFRTLDLLTLRPRRKERRKYGHKKSRKSSQFSKRSSSSGLLFSIMYSVQNRKYSLCKQEILKSNNIYLI